MSILYTNAKTLIEQAKAAGAQHAYHDMLLALNEQLIVFHQDVAANPAAMNEDHNSNFIAPLKTKYDFDLPLGFGAHLQSPSGDVFHHEETKEMYRSEMVRRYIIDPIADELRDLRTKFGEPFHPVVLLNSRGVVIDRNTFEPSIHFYTTFKLDSKT